MRDWKVRSTKVDAGDFKHELLNRLRSIMEVNVLKFGSNFTKKKKPAVSLIGFYFGAEHLVST